MLALVLAAGCCASPPDAGRPVDAGRDAEADAAEPGDRVCPEAYALLVSCFGLPPERRQACREDRRALVQPSSLPVFDALLASLDERCAESRGAAVQPCVFDRCSDAMRACLADARAVRNPCDAGSENEQGIGRPCREDIDCQALGRHMRCPYAIPPPEERERVNLPRWCNHLCEEDIDCGEGAFCWWRASWEGRLLVGSCALFACLDSNTGGGE